MWPFSSKNIVDQAMFGQMAQPTPLMPQAPRGNGQVPAQSNNLMRSPALYDALARMGSAMLIANEAGKGFGGSLGYGIQAFGEAQAADGERRLREAQIKQIEADSAPRGPFSGDGFDNQIAATQYQYYISQGLDDLTARQRALNDALGARPQFQMVTDAAGNVRMMPVPRGSIPMGGQPAPQGQGDLTQPAPPSFTHSESGVVMPQPTMQMPTGGLLPPPAALSAGEAAMPATAFQAQIANNPNAAQKGAEEAAKLGAAAAQDRATMLRDMGDTSRLIEQMLQVSDNTLTPVGLPVEAKQTLARTLGLGGQVQEQLNNTAKLSSITVEALGPILRKLMGPGVITNTDYNNAMKVFGDKNSTPEERRAVLTSLKQRNDDFIARNMQQMPAQGPANPLQGLNDDELMKVIMGGQ